MNTHSDIRLTSKLYYYAADVTDVYDGDTLTVDLDLGLGVWQHGVTIRLWKVDTPEVRGAEREKGLEVRDLVRGLILHKSILLRTILDKRGEDRTGKFGRLLGEVLVTNERGALINVNDLLLGLGLAIPMNEDGSTATTRAVQPAAATAPPIPAIIVCPFCGEERAVEPTGLPAATDHTATDDESSTKGVIMLVAQCPNCLDAARPLNEFQRA
jgi:micrococcal nuclease